MATNYSCLLCVIILCGVSGALGDVNILDYLFWKKADMEAWHEFFPERAIEEERLTADAALNADAAMRDDLNMSLARIVTFQANELQIAEQMVQGTQAEGCVKGIADFMPTSIGEATAAYADCTADVASKLLRLNSTWASKRAAYMKSYSRAVSGIDACARSYPNRNQFDRLRSCVESMINDYLKVAQTTQAAMFPSPSMSYFESVPIVCARTAANYVAAQGYQFLNMLVDCAALIKDKIDFDKYKYQLSQWTGYKDDLDEQLKVAQDRNYKQVGDVEALMLNYYNDWKVDLEKSVIEIRGLAYYQSIVFNALDEYYNTITAVAVDNPVDATCVNAARSTLDVFAATAANASLGCDADMVNRTKQLISQVFSELRALNEKMPQTGNAALLACLAAGYPYAPGTIADCFNLTFIDFVIDFNDRNVTIQTDTHTLYTFKTSFTSGGLPCGGSSLGRLLLAGQRVLYELQRCLYTNSGTTYDVTTPMPMTPTVTSNTTTHSAATTPIPYTKWVPHTNTTAAPYPYSHSPSYNHSYY